MKTGPVRPVKPVRPGLGSLAGPDDPVTLLRKNRSKISQNQNRLDRINRKKPNFLLFKIKFKILIFLTLTLFCPIF